MISRADDCSTVVNLLDTRSAGALIASMFLFLAILAGCGSGVSNVATGIHGTAFSGHVYSGKAPVQGSTVQIFAMGTTGMGAAATPLLSHAVITDASGAFSVPSDYSCQSGESQLYLLATGSDKQNATSVDGSDIALISVLGKCNAIPNTQTVLVNEITTVGAVWPLAPFMNSETQIGASENGAADLDEAIQTVMRLVDIHSGISPGSSIPLGDAIPTSKIDTLGNILSLCSGPGASTPCGNTLSTLVVQPVGAIHPDLISTALSIARNPSQNVLAIYGLQPVGGQFQPILDSPPSDWTVSVLVTPAVPVISPSSGTIVPGQSITISDSSPSVTIFYTEDGSIPSKLSQRYNGPITLTESATLRAVAVTDSSSSAVVSAAFALSTSTPVSIRPSEITLGAAQLHTFTATAGNAVDSNVQWSISPAIGSISAAGIYTSPSVLSQPTNVIVTATEKSNPSQAANAVVHLVPSVQLTLSPVSIALSPSQTQPFVATVTGSANKAVRFSISPSIGTLSSDGTYTAPAAITTPQIVTLTATSLADPTQSVQATINLAATIPGTLMGLTVGDFINQHPAFHYGTTRSWDSGGGSSPVDWSDLNPSPGVYNLAPIDSYIAFNQTSGSEGIYTFGRTPRWASTQPNKTGSPYGPGQCAPPTDISNWDAFVRAVVSRAKGRIKYWELWNEPQDPRYYCGDIPTLVTMSQHAQRIIKSIDPSAVILSPAVTGPDGPSWLASYLAAGGREYIDVLAFHGYWNARAEDAVTVIENYKQVSKVAGLSDLPLWDTESSWAGFGDLGTPTAEQQSSFIPKYFLLHWSEGVSRLLWYAYDGGATWGGLEINGAATSAATAFQQTYQWVVGASLAQPCAPDLTQTWTCTLQRSEGYSAQIVWNSVTEAQIPVPPQYTQYRDLSGTVHVLTTHTIAATNKPVLLETGTPN